METGVFGGMQGSGVALRCLGGVSPALVNAAYPMKALTAYHYAHHIPGLTGRWMDTGATALGGAVRGSFHRLAHGHHLFADGFKVLVNPRLKFGEFLHHLGMDALTVRGIPNPLFPAALGRGLLRLGLFQRFVSEFMTLNLPKILGGSLRLVCSGADVLMAFSDAIPHTWLATGMHFGFGVLDTVFGLFPPNPLLLGAGVAEFGVAAATAWRTVVDPVLPVVGVPGSVFLPALGHAVGLSAILGACTGYLRGGWAEAGKCAAAGGAAAAAATGAGYAAAAGGCFLGPFAGPLAGIATFLLAKKALDWLFPARAERAVPSGPCPRDGGGDAESGWDGFARDVPRHFRMPNVLPLPGLPEQPIGRLEDGRLSFDGEAFGRLEEKMACQCPEF